MSSDLPPPHLSAKPSPSSISPGPLRHVPDANVPVFNCVVYVTKVQDGVRIRVANLAGLEAIAPSERAALAIVVPNFKQQVADFLKSEKPVPWIHPPLPPQQDEQIRLIPVHL